MSAPPLRRGAFVAPRGGAALLTETGELEIGTPVEVLNRFEDRWTHGFSVAVIGDSAYQLRRLSDGCVLPAWFPAEMIRADHGA